jgi:hypothetical protein
MVSISKSLVQDFVGRGSEMKPPVFDATWSEEIKAIYCNEIQEMWDVSLNRHVGNQYHNQLGVDLKLAGFPGVTGAKKPNDRSVRLMNSGILQHPSLSDLTLGSVLR